MTQHIYLHIPFCQRRCSYCDFNTYANLEDRVDAYVEALAADIRRSNRDPEDWRQLPRAGSTCHVDRAPGDLLRADLRPTIFLGGGTPTMLTLKQMERVLAATAEIIPFDHAEITTEANPGTVLDEDYLRGLRSLGINRISFGVQSLHDPTLRVLGRIHTAAEAIETYRQARRAGFDRINLDFIFGLPGQTLEQWAWTLDQVAALDADHFSLYSLIVEPGTPLHQQVTRGSITVPDDDDTGAMYELAIERLGGAGYVQYEISNWAKPGMQSTPLPQQAAYHNVAYWLNADYLAFGAGAHGHLYPRRWHDLLRVDEYISAVEAGQVPISEETELNEADLRAETMMMGLRLNSGVSYAHFRDRCGSELQAVYGTEIATLVADGLLLEDTTGVRLSERGRALGNQVFLQFLG
jgi:oxygen-independent coproporphyrinogen III oxidase